MSTERYTVTFRDGLYHVVDRRTGRSVTGHRRLEEARHSVLRHRLVRTLDALVDGVSAESLIDAVFAAVPTP